MIKENIQLIRVPYSASTSVRLHDFELIADFQKAGPNVWQSMLRDLGSESAERLQSKLARLPHDWEQLIVATHVPPYREACWYQGETTDDNWAPFFVCGQVGDVLRDFAKAHPSKQITVLCGHSHHAGTATICENLTVLTGSADYGRPTVQQVLELA